MKKGWTPRDRPAYDVHGALQCGYCRKRAYPSRRLAKKALRVFYPGDVGEAMSVYRCTAGGTEWHFGHRDRLAAEAERRRREEEAAS